MHIDIFQVRAWSTYRCYLTRYSRLYLYSHIRLHLRYNSCQITKIHKIPNKYRYNRLLDNLVSFDAYIYIRGV